MSIWSFLSDSANASAVSAVSAFVQAIAAAISLFIVLFLSLYSNRLTKQQQSREVERSSKLTRKVAGVLALRVEMITEALEDLSGLAHPDPFVSESLSKGLPDGIIVEALDVELVRETFDDWEVLRSFQSGVKDKISMSWSAEDIQKHYEKYAAGWVVKLLNLKHRLTAISKRK